MAGGDQQVFRALARSLLRQTYSETFKNKKFTLSALSNSSSTFNHLLQLIAQDEFGSTIAASSSSPRNADGTRKAILALIRHGEGAIKKYEKETGVKIDPLDMGFDILKQLGSFSEFVEALEKKEDREGVKYRIGDVVRHNLFNYRGVIIGWDKRPVVDVSKKWDGVRATASGAEQPFYKLLPDRNDLEYWNKYVGNYVAQENLTMLDTHESRIKNDEMHHYFKEGFIPSMNCYLPNEWILDVYPHDWEDDRLKEAMNASVDERSMDHYATAKRVEQSIEEMRKEVRNSFLRACTPMKHARETHLDSSATNGEDVEKGNIRSLFGPNGPFHSLDIKHYLKDMDELQDIYVRKEVVAASSARLRVDPLIEELKNIIDFLPVVPDVSAHASPWNSVSGHKNFPQLGSSKDMRNTSSSSFDQLKALLKSSSDSNDDDVMESLRYHLYHSGVKDYLFYGPFLQLSWLSEAHENLKNLVTKRSVSNQHYQQIYNERSKQQSSLKKNSKHDFLGTQNNKVEDEFYFKQLELLLESSQVFLDDEDFLRDDNTEDLFLQSNNVKQDSKSNILNPKKKIDESKPHSNYFKQYKKNLKSTSTLPKEFNPYDGIPTPTPIACGTIVKHVKFGYRGVIAGWDSKPTCDVSKWDGIVQLDEELRAKYKQEYERKYRDFILEKKKLLQKKQKSAMNSDNDNQEIDIDDVQIDSDAFALNIESSKIYNQRPFYVVLCDEESEANMFGEDRVMGVRYVAHDNLEVIPKNSEECSPISNSMTSHYFSNGFFDMKGKNYLPNSKLRYLYPGVAYHSLSPYASQREYEERQGQFEALNHGGEARKNRSVTKKQMNKLSSSQSLALFKRHGKKVSSSESTVVSSLSELADQSKEQEASDEEIELLTSAAARDEAEYSGFMGLSEALDDVLLSLDIKLTPFSSTTTDEENSARLIDDLLKLLKDASNESDARIIEQCIRMVYGRPPPSFQDHYSYSTYPANLNIQWNTFFKTLTHQSTQSAIRAARMASDSSTSATDDSHASKDSFLLIDSLVKKSLYYCRQAEENQLVGEYKKAAEYYTKAFKVSNYISSINTTLLASSSNVNLRDNLWLNPLHGAGTCRFMNGEYEKAQELFMKVLSEDPNNFLALYGLSLTNDGAIPMHGDASLAYETFKKSLVVNPWSVMMWPRYIVLKGMTKASNLTNKSTKTSSSSDSVSSESSLTGIEFPWNHEPSDGGAGGSFEK